HRPITFQRSCNPSHGEPLPRYSRTCWIGIHLWDEIRMTSLRRLRVEDTGAKSTYFKQSRILRGFLKGIVRIRRGTPSGIMLTPEFSQPGCGHSWLPAIEYARPASPEYCVHGSLLYRWQC